MVKLLSTIFAANGTRKATNGGCFCYNQEDDEVWPATTGCEFVATGSGKATTGEQICCNRCEVVKPACSGATSDDMGDHDD